MPAIEVLFYQEGDGSLPPVITWLLGLQDKAKERCFVRLEMLRDYGDDLDRPHSAYLGDDIYELRIRFFKVNYRILYFFHGKTAAVVSHGIAKEKQIPKREIEVAKRRMTKFKANPGRHTFRPSRTEFGPADQSQDNDEEIS